MYNELLKLLKNSRSDYYNFKVSAILVSNDGRLFNGVNIETSSPQAGICAERNALFNAMSNGLKKEDFKELHIMVDSDKYSFPCYICRQALNDFVSKDLPIYLYSKNKFEERIILKDLLSHSFDKEDLL
ncbi:MAG: cytidine deaminase [Bacilli bacterium]|nr:cytidine deaminase [Bacilli bacterium]